MDSKEVWLLDSNSQNEQLSDLSKLYPGFIRYAKSKNISEQIIALIKPDKTGLLSKISGKSVEKPGYVFIHQGDLINIDPSNLELLKTKDNVVFFSGAVVGSEGKRIYPRSIIYKYLREFINRWFSNSPEDAVVFLASKETKMDSLDSAKNLHLLINWKERHQHDFVNILAPADLNAIFYAGGELNKEQYVKTRDEIKLRVKLAQDKVGKVSFRNLYKEAWQIFENDDPIISIKPDISPERVSIGEIVPATIIHIDDDINNGWDLVFNSLFKGRYFSATASDAGKKLIEEHRDEPVVILLDLGLKPGESVSNSNLISGLKLLKEIREAPSKASLPVFVMSAFDDSLAYEKCLQLGADGFIVKPSRILSGKSDQELNKELRDKFVKMRFSIVKDYFYKAFKELESKEVINNSISAKSELRMLLQSILATDFSMFQNDDYASNRISSLIIETYKVFEKGEVSRATHLKGPSKTFAKLYRNISAHRNQNYKYDFKDLIIFWSLIFESLEDVKCDRSKDYINKSFDLLFLDASCSSSKMGSVTSTKFNRGEATGKQSLDFIQSFCFENRDIDDQPVLDHLSKKLLEFRDSKLPSVAVLLYKLMIEEYRKDGDQPPLLVYFIDSLNVKNEFKYIEVSVPVESVITQSENRGLPRNIEPEKSSLVVSKRENKNAKGFTHWFSDRKGQLIYLHGKFRGEILDKNDKNQINYWQWYFNKHVVNYKADYQNDFVAWLEGLLKTDLPATLSKEKNTPVAICESKVKCNGFSVSMVPVNSSRPLDRNYLEGLVCGLFVDDPHIVRDPQKAKIYLYSNIENGRKTYRGVQLSLKKDREGKQFILFSPSNITSEIRSDVKNQKIIKDCIVSQFTSKKSGKYEKVLDGGGGEFIKTKDAFSLFSKTLDELYKIDPDVISRDFTGSSFYKTGSINTPLSNDFNQLLDKQLVGKCSTSLGAVKLCVVNESSSQTSFTELVSALKRDLVSIEIVEKIEDSDLFVVIVNPNLVENHMSEVICRFQEYKKPWSIVNPDNFRNKSWNIIVGLTTKMQRPFWNSAISNMGKRTWFLGLDLGHSKKDGNSYLAAVLVNHKGHLISWAKVHNGEHNINQNMEQISEVAFNEVKDKLLKEAHFLRPFYEIDLIIHRDGIDGPNSENDKILVNNLEQSLGFSSVSWIEIVKQGVPCFDNSSVGSAGPGTYIIFEDVKGQEFWLMTTKSNNRNLVKPLKIIIKHCDPGIDPEIFVRQIYDLSSIPVMDYKIKQKLPLTTYLADGLSSTGEKQATFCGFEHLRS